MKPPSLRVISGRLRGRRFLAPKGLATRPSLEKTRGMIFDVLCARYDLSLYRGADLFAGSGALGLEAYSRGAEPVVFTENGAAFGPLSATLNQLLPQGAFFLAKQDALKWLRLCPPGAAKPWLLLLDPPYQGGQGHKALEEISLRFEVFLGSLVVLEASRDQEPPLLPHLSLWSSKLVGQSRVDFFLVEP